MIAWLRSTTPSIRSVLVGAVLFRLVALPMLPSLSDDGYRYLWDGKVVVEAGVSPYALRPSDPQLRALQGSVEYGRMNSQGYYSVYPPVPQAGFALAAALGTLGDWRVGWWAWKLLMVLAEGVAILLLVRSSGPRLAALYAWSPLAVVEVAGQGHTEALVLLGLALALQVGRWSWPAASIGLTLAGGTKLYPFLWLPQAWRREGWRGIAASLCIVGFLAVPISAPGALGHIGESLGLFFGMFDEYAAPYLLLKS
ncbi:MAG: glycosyltransferase 87 family protein, partial [Parerythrobacter sp.]